MARFCLRLVGLLPLAWVCLIGTWLFLPSPTVNPSNRDGHIQARLRSGAALTTVTEITESFKKTNREDLRHSDLCGGCVGLVLDWRLESHVASDSVILHLGEARINLTESALRFSDLQEDMASKKADGTSKHYYVSDPITARLRVGGIDHAIIMPWFNWADKILIYWTEHTPQVDLYFRVIVPAAGVVEIWKDTPDLKSVFADPQTVPNIRDTDMEVSMLASFSKVPTTRIQDAAVRANTMNIDITHVQGQQPSKTWPIRSLICGPLYVPTFMLLALFITFVVPNTIIGALVEAFVLLGLVVWVCNGRRHQRLCGRRARKASRRGIWSVAGPVSDEELGLLHKDARRRPLGMTTKSLRLFEPSRSRSRLFDKY